MEVLKKFPETIDANLIRVTTNHEAIIYMYTTNSLDEQYCVWRVMN